MAALEMYRKSTIGMRLTETLDEMVLSGAVTPELALRVVMQFDQSMTNALEHLVKSRATIKGHLRTYRFCDNVWTFILRNVTVKNEEITQTVRRMKIVACNSELVRIQP